VDWEYLLWNEHLYDFDSCLVRTDLGLHDLVLYLFGNLVEA
jgi:hypothetical protein